MPKTHYLPVWNAARAACGIPRQRAWTTNAPHDVTCERCRKYMLLARVVSPELRSGARR